MKLNHKLPKLIRKLSSIPVAGPMIKESYRHFWHRQFMRNWEKVNSEAALVFQQNLAPLTPAQERVVSDLKSSGIAFAQIDELLLDQDAMLWTELQKTINQWLDRPDVATPERPDPSARHWKDYILRYHGSGAQIPANCPLLRLGLSGSILNVANGYLGLWSKLSYIDAWNTMPEPQEGRTPAASQRWHRDPEDLKLCKVFLYHSDVDDGAGPLHYLPNCRPGERYGHLWPQELPVGSNVVDSEFEKKAPRSEWRVCHGKAGTIVFVDTVGFHMGGRASLRNRIFSHWTFATPGSHWPRMSFFSPEVVGSFKTPQARWALQCGRNN
jgi:hypothetical protein